MKNYKKHYQIKATPQDVYAALTNPDIIALWSGEEAIMEVTPGSEFSWWNGDICGKNIEFEPNKKIVQEWCFGDEPSSLVTIKLHIDKKGTDVEIHQIDIPDEAFENIEEGWNEAIIASLKELLEE
jgi:activator of HSP90 ATPase